MVNEFRGEVFSCPNGTSTGCLNTGEAVLQAFNMQNIDIWRWCLVLLGMLVGYRILTFLALRYLQKEKR